MPLLELTKSLSYYPMMLRMVSQETEVVLALGTGFVYEYEDFYFLITNGHNITGVNPETNTRLSSHAAYPATISTSARIKQKLEDGREVLGKSEHSARIDLYKDSECVEPLWYIHPVHGYNVDVVAVPICSKADLPEHVELLPLNLYHLFEAKPEVADDVYILGYPFGITDELELPIWKRGSIATEPNIPFQGLPKMLVDTASRSGMSGSPVILMRSGVHNMSEGKFTDDSVIGTIFGFVGVYSGRIGAKDQTEAQLGIVWRKEVIEEILTGKVLGSTDFQRV